MVHIVSETVRPVPFSRCVPFPEFIAGVFSEYVWKNLTGFLSHFLLFMSPLVLRLHLLDLCMTVFFQLQYIFITWCRNVDNMFSSCLSKRIMFVVYVCSLLVSLYVSLKLFHVLSWPETCFRINKDRLFLTLSACVLGWFYLQCCGTYLVCTGFGRGSYHLSLPLSLLLVYQYSNQLCTDHFAPYAGLVVLFPRHGRVFGCYLFCCLTFLTILRSFKCQCGIIIGIQPLILNISYLA